MLEDILFSPITNEGVYIDAEKSCAIGSESKIEYPIKDDIIDFLPEVNDQISEAYDSISFCYDDYANLSSLKWKIFTLFTWGFLDDSKYIQKVLDSIPEDFDGVILDAPVGTGILTVHKYRQLGKAKIIALDYSLSMLRKARNLYTANGIDNVTYIRGDIGSLPLRHASVDLCLSMGGYHAFSDKTQALEEIARVLRTNGTLSGGFYVRGKRLLTDLLVKYIFSRRGYFSAPFYDEKESLAKFGEYFNTVDYSTRKSFFFFEMTRK